MKLLVNTLMVVTVAVLISCQTVQMDEGARHAVSGRVLHSDGVTPAAGAVVTARKKSVLPLGAVNGTAKKMLSELSTTVDNEGVFSFDSIDYGEVYVVETEHEDGIAMIDSVLIVSQGEQFECPDMTLKPAGTVRGSVGLTAGVSGDGLYICAFGSNRYAAVQSDGSFVLGDLPEGVVTLRVLDENMAYRSENVADVQIVSGETIEIEPVPLVPLVLPVPQNLRVEIDSTSSYVLLTWNNCGRVGDYWYTVYRKDAGMPGPGEEIRNYDFTNDNWDTVFLDNTVEVGKTYEYRVAVRSNLDTKEGGRSAAVEITVTSVFVSDTTISVERVVEGLDFARTVYIATGVNKEIYAVPLYDLQILHMNGMHGTQRLVSTGLKENGSFFIAAGPDGRVYLANAATVCDMTVDADGRPVDAETGRLIYSSIEDEIPVEGYYLYDINHTEILRANRNITVLDENGTLIDSVTGPLVEGVRWMCAGENRMFIRGGGHNGADTVAAYGYDGVLQGVWQITDKISHVAAVAAGDDEGFYTLEDSPLRIVKYDGDGNAVMQKKIEGLPILDMNDDVALYGSRNGKHIYLVCRNFYGRLTIVKIDEMMGLKVVVRINSVEACGLNNKIAVDDDGSILVSGSYHDAENDSWIPTVTRYNSADAE